MTIRRLAAAALMCVLFVPPLPAAAAAPGSSEFRFDLAGVARTSVESDLALVVEPAGSLVQRLAGRVAFDADVDRCKGKAASCSYPRQGADGRWGIHLDAQTTSATFPSNRFLVYHEIGHAVWGLLLDASQRRAFSVAVDRSLAGQPCLDDLGRPCAEIQEVFADEFARYAGGFKVSMSYYCTPPLLDAETFAGVVQAA